jgi:hypothetical protein
MNFIDAEEIINIVKNNLNTYFESNLIDDSILYPRLEICLGELGVRAYQKTSVTLDVKNGKAKLPDDFHSLLYAFSCSSYKVKEPKIQGIIGYEHRICDIPKCKTACDYCHDDNGMYQIMQRFEDTYVWHKDAKCLTVTEMVDNDCNNERPRLKKDETAINDGYIYTAFDTGTVYIEYRKTSATLMVPDYPEIRDWLISEMTTMTFQRIWYNRDDDNVIQRYQESKAETAIKKYNKTVFWRRFERRDFNDLKKELIRNSKKLSRL